MDKYYTNYLNYFTTLLTDSPTPITTALSYALHPSLFPCLLSGAIHPLIHTGFGIEFENVNVMAEGLSEACVHAREVAPVLPGDGEWEGGVGKLVDVLESVRADKALDGIVRFEDENKTKRVLASEEAVKSIKAHVVRYEVGDTLESVRASFHDLIQTTTLLLAGTAFHPTQPQSHRPKLDFFLMHAFTSSFALRQILPHVTPAQAQTLLRSHAAVSLMHYVARGRPPIQKQALESYVPSDEANQGWHKVMEMAVRNHDLHVPKVVRGLKWFYDENKDSQGDVELFLKAAQVTVDEFEVRKGDWFFKGVGFKEAWGESGMGKL
ncbi:hypothetical protein HK104_003548 [Borealophlyctis nickersoniae]|nr:hypothetical protein HK104_003548 [Borealophlyctis nickersoniae]